MSKTYKISYEESYSVIYFDISVTKQIKTLIHSPNTVKKKVKKYICVTNHDSQVFKCINQRTKYEN